MTLAPDVVQLLAEFEASGVKPYDQLSVLQARAVVESSRRLQGPKVDLALTRDLLLPGQAGMLPARLYVPFDRHDRAPILYLHGGGWVTGSVSIADRPCRRLAEATRRPVVSLDYRLAPETRHPGQAEDVYAALSGLTDRLEELELHAGGVVVCGDSAGANLAATVCLMARDRHGPEVSHQVLLYPTLAPARGNLSPSYQDNADGYVLSANSMVWFWDHYLGPDQDGHEPYAAPLWVQDLSGLPGATVVTAQYDPLRDDGVGYASRLAVAGVDVEHVNFADQSHGFFWMAGVLEGAAQLLDYLAERLDKLP